MVSLKYFYVAFLNRYHLSYFYSHPGCWKNISNKKVAFRSNGHFTGLLPLNLHIDFAVDVNEMVVVL